MDAKHDESVVIDINWDSDTLKFVNLTVLPIELEFRPDLPDVPPAQQIFVGPRDALVRSPIPREVRETGRLGWHYLPADHPDPFAPKRPLPPTSI